MSPCRVALDHLPAGPAGPDVRDAVGWCAWRLNPAALVPSAPSSHPLGRHALPAGCGEKQGAVRAVALLAVEAWHKSYVPHCPPPRLAQLLLARVLHTLCSRQRLLAAAQQISSTTYVSTPVRRAPELEKPHHFHAGHLWCRGHPKGHSGGQGGNSAPHAGAPGGSLQVCKRGHHLIRSPACICGSRIPAGLRSFPVIYSPSVTQCYARATGFPARCARTKGIPACTWASRLSSLVTDASCHLPLDRCSQHFERGLICPGLVAPQYALLFPVSNHHARAAHEPSSDCRTLQGLLTPAVPGYQKLGC